MNNLNALNHHIASLNNAISALNRSHQELSMKVNTLDEEPRAVGTVDMKKQIDEAVAGAVGNVKAEILNSIESLINSLDIDKKIEDAMAKVKSDIDQAIDVDITLPDPPQCLDEVVDDDMFMSTKDDKPKTKKKSTKRQS